MKIRIYRNIFAITIISVLLTTILSMVAFYNVFNKQMEMEVKNQAILYGKSLHFLSNNLDYIHSLKLTKQDARLSIIQQNGMVVYDSFHDVVNMENHSDRPEVKEAFEKGFGQSTRFSNTLGETTFYYALRLNDQSVLRLAKTTNSIFGIFLNITPLIIAIILVSFFMCNFFAIRLTKRIVEPINNIDLTTEQEMIYEELTPFIKTIKNQKEKIDSQFLALEDRANTINTITKNMREGILILDKNGFILLVNNSALDFFQAAENDYMGKNTLELIRNIDLQDAIKKTLLGTGCNITLHFGEKITEVFLSPVFINGNINGAIVLFLDITAKFSAEKMRREFSANVSHELKTPLTTIAGLSEMINNDMVKSEDIKNFSGKIKDEAARLITLIEDIIKISEMDENVSAKQLNYFDITAVANDVIKCLQPSANMKNVSLFVTGDKKLIHANNQMIFEMLYNLVDNAIKYNKTNGSVTISISDEIGKTKIEVSDTGIGISNLHLNRVFERFYRVDKSRSKKTGGTGLGLSIVKHIVEYHDGSVTIQSDLDIGTKVMIIIANK